MRSNPRRRRQPFSICQAAKWIRQDPCPKIFVLGIDSCHGSGMDSSGRVATASGASSSCIATRPILTRSFRNCSAATTFGSWTRVTPTIMNSSMMDGPFLRQRARGFGVETGKHGPHPSRCGLSGFQGGAPARRASTAHLVSLTRSGHHHAIHHMDHTIRLENIRDGDRRDITFVVGEREMAIAFAHHR
jgi:predicted nucleic acid binding AN1-type Zn finger protein